MYKNWLAERGEQFRSGIQIATLDPFQGYKNAIDDQLQDATSVPGAFHIVKLAADALDEVRRRVQQDTPRQKERLREALVADEAHISVEVAYLHRASARGLPPSHTRPRPTPGHAPHREPANVSHPRNHSPGPDPTQVEGRLPWPTSTPEEPATGQQKPSTDIIELGRRTARGYRNPTNHQLRMLLIAGGLDASTHTQL